MRSSRVSHSLPNFKHAVESSIRTTLQIGQSYPLIEPQAPLPTYSVAKGPISRVPNEVLAEIFLLLRAQTVFSGGWVRILQVCKHWYAVAKGLAELWARVCVDQPAASLERFFLYSKGRPLHVEFHPRTLTDTLPFLNSMRSHSNRVHTLSATFPWCQDYHRLLSIIGSSLPQLRDVSMNVTHPQLRNVSMNISYPLPIIDHPHIFFLDICPAVQSVRLINVGVSFNGDSLASLTKLKIDNLFGLPNLSTLVAILQAASALMYLELLGPCDEIEQGAADLQTETIILPVNLSKLKRLVLRTDPEFTREFLQVVATPRSADVVICLPVISLCGVPSTFLRYALPPQAKLSNIGSLDRINEISIKLHGMAPSLMGYDIRDVHTPFLTLMIVDTTYPPRRTPPQSIVDTFSQVTRFLGVGERVTSLELTGDAEEIEEYVFDLFGIFQALPRLRELSAGTRCISGVLAALSCPCTNHGDQEMSALCPDLAKIRFTGIEVSDGLLVDMLDCFERRRELGAVQLKVLGILASKELESDHKDMLQGVAERLESV